MAGIANFTACSLLVKTYVKGQFWPVSSSCLSDESGGALEFSRCGDAERVYDRNMAERLAILGLVMAAIGVAAGGALIAIMAIRLIRPKRMSDGRALVLLHRLTPADLGLEFENVWYEVIDQRDGGKLKMAGWWIPSAEASGRCAVILHGYSDAKVGGIAWAPLLRSLGFNILAIDLRGHGESGGRNISAGYWERHDLNQILDQTKCARPAETRQILLFGVSLGAAVAAATAVMRNDLWAVILEGPFASFQGAAARHGDNLGTPGPFFQTAAFRLAEWLAGADFDVVRPADTIGKIPCPVMVIQAGDDPFVSEAEMAAVRRAVQSRDSSRGPSVCWELPGVHHVVGLRHDPREYRRRIEEFLLQVLPSAVQACEK
jgi:pimeloyl-ACP methyl ester carboxylesterase